MHWKPGIEILAAGLIAGGVVACADVASEMIGEGLVDAGELLADAGRELRDSGAGALEDAGELVQDAGRALAGSGGGRDASAQPGEPDLPNPRYILRDRSGDPVDAWVQPSCGFDATADEYKACAAVASPTIEDFPCVWVDWVGQRRHNTRHRLDTGQTGNCDQQTAPTLEGAPFTLELVY